MNKEVLQEKLWNKLRVIKQLIKFYRSPKTDKQLFYDHTKKPMAISYYEGLRDRLVYANIPVEEVRISLSDFMHWLDNFSELKNFYQTRGDVYVEKCLEHYLTFKHLGLSDNDVHIDIAASDSPWTEILNGKGIKSYRLDLIYPKGIHGINIGSDAGNICLPDNFCSAMSLHCSYECFMGNADTGFLKEAGRILNDYGRYAIIPLYLDDVYFNMTSPYCNQEKIEIDSEAKKIWREDKYQIPFSRHYSPESFLKRIYLNLPLNMEGKVLYFSNLGEIRNHFKGQVIYSFFMFYCAKKR